MQYIRLLRHNAEFSKLWLAQVISLFGDWFNTIAISAIIANFTKGTGYEGIAVSGYLLARVLPPLLVGPIGGVLIDRFNRKTILIISDLSRAGVVFLLLFANDPSLLWLIYVLTIVQFALSSVFEPARNAIMPSLLRNSEDLVLGNTLSSVTWSAMLAIGAIAGGVVASVFGITFALVIDALTFILSAVIVWTIKLKPVPVDMQSLQESEPNERTLRQGLRYLRHNPAAATSLFVKTAISIGSVDTLLIIYGTQLFVIGEDGTTSMAILWSAFGIGAIIGPFILNYFTNGSIPSLRRMIIIGFITIPIGWFAFGLAPTLLFVSVAILIRAMGGSITWTYSSVLIQKSVADEYLGRTFSLDMMGFQFMTAVSTVVVGILIDVMGTDHIRDIAIGTGVVSLAPLLIWIAIVRYFEQRETQEPTPQFSEN